jgi:hypothetical protein
MLHYNYYLATLSWVMVLSRYTVCCTKVYCNTHATVHVLSYCHVTQTLPKFVIVSLFLHLHYRNTFVPVLNWDTKAPVDWRGSYLEQFMPANRGATAYAAALKKSVTVPESQATTTRTSSSPNTTAEERRTPEKDSHPNRTQRKPPKDRNTPEKDKDANVSKNKTHTKARNGKKRHETESHDNDDSITAGDKSDSESQGACTGKQKHSDDEGQSDDDDNSSLQRKRKPLKVTTTPEKVAKANRSKKTSNDNARNGKLPNEKDAHENDDFNPPGENCDSDFVDASSEKQLQSDDEQKSNDDDNHSHHKKRMLNENEQDSDDFEESTDSEDADIGTRSRNKKRGPMRLQEDDLDVESQKTKKEHKLRLFRKL